MPYESQNQSPILFVDEQDIEPRHTTALIKFTLPITLSRHAVSQAVLELFTENAYRGAAPQQAEAAVLTIAENWEASTVTPRNKPALKEDWLVTATPQDKIGGWTSWDVTSAVMRWLNGESAHGFAVVGIPDSDHRANYWFSSMETSRSPRLIITMDNSAVQLYLPISRVETTQPSEHGYRTDLAGPNGYSVTLPALTYSGYGLRCSSKLWTLSRSIR